LGNYIEATKGCVLWENIELSVVESLLEYAYIGEITLTDDNVQATLQAADYLQVLSSIFLFYL